MIRLLFIVFAVLVVLAALGYLGYRVVLTPRRRLLMQFHRMKQLVLTDVDEADRDRAEHLLEDCESHLQQLVRTHDRLETLSEMADTASELTGATSPDDLERMHRDVRDDVSHFLSEMAQISSRVGRDDRQSIERLQDFTEELEDRQQVLAELEEFE